jgi:hypothetical protein
VGLVGCAVVGEKRFDANTVHTVAINREIRSIMKIRVLFLKVNDNCKRMNILMPAKPSSYREQYSLSITTPNYFSRYPFSLPSVNV